MYCTHCGAQLQPAATFCAACGKPVAMAQTPKPGSRLVHHLRLMGVLWIGLSALRLLGALCVILVAVFIFSQGRWEGPVNLVSGILWACGVFLLLLAGAGLAAGWGLLERAPWARSIALAAAAVSLIDIPFGTALGVYTLWLLLPAEAADDYDRLARAA
ncbi:MAG: zinc-ribbon domain-containing protein [Terriglobia bacterium]